MSRLKYLSSVTALLFAGVNVFISTSFAQDSSKTLTLDAVIEATLKNNKSIQLAKLDQNIAAANYKQTQAIFMPQADLSYTAMSTNNPLNAFGFKLQQAAITSNDFNPNVLNHPASTADFMTQLEVKQPLLNVDMLYMRKGAAKQTEVYQYKLQRTQEYITFEAKKAYLQLQLAYQAVRVLTEAEQNAKAVFTFVDNRFKQGLIQRSDLLNAQVHVSTVESNLAKASSSVRNACDYLSLLMGQPAGTLYTVNYEAPIALPVVGSTLKVLDSRSDFMAMQKAIEASGLMLQSSQMGYLPKLNAFGNYQYHDSKLTGFGANAYLVGVQLSWNVFNGNKTKNVIATQKLERDKLAVELARQKDQSQLELDKAYRDLTDAGFEVRQEQEAVAQAAEALRILQNRYQQGLVNTTDVLTADSQLAQLKFSLAQALFTTNLSKAYIQLLTTTTTK